MSNHPNKETENPNNSIDTDSAAMSKSIPATKNTEAYQNYKKKTWKNYFWEFFMLFLAVFCGFLAQWQLENILDQNREKEYISLLIKELEIDNEKINTVYNDTLRNNQIDNFINALTNIDNNPNNIKNAYLQVGNILTFNVMVFNRSTLSQLKSGGNMRLIRNRAVVDSIHLIDNSIEQIEKQLRSYETLVLNNSVYIGKIFDSRYFLKFRSTTDYKGNFYDYIEQHPNIQYLNPDEKLRAEFSMIIAYQKSAFENYIFMLHEYQKLSKRVLLFIKKEYHLE